MRNAIFIFDIDGTLAEINRAVEPRLAEVLGKLAASHTLCFASGKPFAYIAGFCRQLGLPESVIIAENGAVVAFDAGFPPKRVWHAPVADETRAALAELKDFYAGRFGETIWFQPNEAALTVFPFDRSLLPELGEIAHSRDLRGCRVFIHADSVDIVPPGIDKGVALIQAINGLGASQANVAAFGDGTNDIPLFNHADSVVIVGELQYISSRKVFRVSDIDKLREHLESLLADSTGSVAHPDILAANL